MASLPPHSNNSKLTPMRKLTATLCLTLTILLGSVGMSVSAEPVKGIFLLGTKHLHSLIAGKCSASYDKGDYGTALREFQLLSEQGMGPII